MRSRTLIFLAPPSCFGSTYVDGGLMVPKGLDAPGNLRIWDPSCRSFKWSLQTRPVNSIRASSKTGLASDKDSR